MRLHTIAGGWLVLPVAALVMTFAGCGGGGAAGTTAVSGVVTLDGKPLADASVAFVPKDGGVMASAQTDKDGKFTVQAMIGNNQVTVSKASAPVGNPEALMPAGPPPPLPKLDAFLPPKYADPKTSGLGVNVTAGLPDVTFALSTK